MCAENLQLVRMCFARVPTEICWYWSLLDSCVRLVCMSWSCVMSFELISRHPLPLHQISHVSASEMLLVLKYMCAKSCMYVSIGTCSITTVCHFSTAQLLQYYLNADDVYYCLQFAICHPYIDGSTDRLHQSRVKMLQLTTEFNVLFSVLCIHRQPAALSVYWCRSSWLFCCRNLFIVFSLSPAWVFIANFSVFKACLTVFSHCICQLLRCLWLSQYLFLLLLMIIFAGY